MPLIPAIKFIFSKSTSPSFSKLSNKKTKFEKMEGVSFRSSL